jgi:hypothetical protein
MRRSAMVFLCVVAIVACSDSGSKSAPKAERVPIPRVTLPAGASFDKGAWINLWRDTPGSPKERCLDVGRRTDVRSGGFVAGNFVAFARDWDGTGATSKLYYIPSRPNPPAPLDVTATRRGTEPPLVVTLHFGAWFSWSRDGIPFYVTGTVLPQRGAWRLEAVAGQNRGCFELQL